MKNTNKPWIMKNLKYSKTVRITTFYEEMSSDVWKEDVNFVILIVELFNQLSCIFHIQYTHEDLLKIPTDILILSSKYKLSLNVLSSENWGRRRIKSDELS